MLAFVSGCTKTPSSATKLPLPAVEAELAKMFSDAAGKASFSCTDGDGRHEFVCQGRYVPVDPSEGVVAHRIGVSVSHYFEGKPVFAVSVLRDEAARK